MHSLLESDPTTAASPSAASGSGSVDRSAESEISNLELLRLSFTTSDTHPSNFPSPSASKYSNDMSFIKCSPRIDQLPTAQWFRSSDSPPVDRTLWQHSPSIMDAEPDLIDFGPSKSLGNTERISAVDSDDDQDNLDQGYEQDDSSHDDDTENIETSLSIKDLKRKQRAIFDSWVADAAAETTQKEMHDIANAQPNGGLTTRALMADQASELIVNNPREYQLELFERAKKQNTIAVLDTGSGKTLIAVLLLKHVIEQELERRYAGRTPRISFFLVDSVTLVFQQSAVLERNLDYKVGHLYGSMGASAWSKELWNTIYDENMVVVCTAEILVQCLGHSFISIDQINLLIFDEAHHTKKDHPYARLIRDFYRPQEDKTKRPRIFAMTASPIDTKGDIAQMARDLEYFLDSQIATVSDLTMVQKCISRPSEEVGTYDPLRSPFEAPLYKKLQTEFGDLTMFEKYFRDSKTIASELGPWCSDFWWQTVLGEAKLDRLAKRAECEGTRRNVYGRGGSNSPETISKLDLQLRRLEEASKLVQAHHLEAPQYQHSDDLSTKVRHLLVWIRLHYEHPTTARCIVFVERRHTAQLLDKVFKYPHISGPHLRVASFIGSRPTGFDDEKVSTHQQLLTMNKFRKGEINLLFATSVAEEGLDIPDCNLVVRFDLYKTMIAYMQSRGRARYRNSKYLHMIEKHNKQHMQTVWYVRKAEEMMRRFCRGLPDDRRIDESEDDSRRHLGHMPNQRVFTHPETGAKLTYKSSLVILAHYVSSLPQGEGDSVALGYIPLAHAGGWVYEVILPASSPISSAEGCVERQKILAKCSAAFNACLKLIKGGYLDSNFVTTHKKYLPAMRNAHLSLDSRKSNMYKMITKPKVWEIGRGTVPEELHLTILDLPAGCDRPHSPIALLTRVPMPDFPSFSLFLSTIGESRVQSISVRKTLKISTERLEHVDNFTRMIYLHVFAKEFEADVRKMSYWFAPLKLKPGTCTSAMEPSIVIDWDALGLAWAAYETDWNESWTNESLVDKFFWDPYNGGKRYFTLQIDHSLNLESPVPDGIGNPDKRKKTIKDFTVSLWSKSSRKREEFDPYDRKQPVLYVEKMMARRNLLDATNSRDEAPRLKAFIIPQPLKRSPLSTQVVTMALAIPCIIHRLESYLIAREACQLLGLNISLDLALEASTKDSDNTDEHGNEQINLQRGMGKNYERLEFLGDSFLKMATSIAVYTQNPDSDEFDFHVKRMQLICNRNLFEHAKQIQLTEYVRSQAFSRRLWYQEGLKLLKGKKLGKEGEAHEHSLGDKTIADICEALIGAAFLAHNRQGSWNPNSWRDAVHAVTTFVSSEEHCQQKWTDYLAGYTPPKRESKSVSATQLDLAEKVEREHPYHFHSPNMLQVSFKHPSYPRAWLDLPSYQRLEFLGDSLLELACVTHLFYRYPTKDPQWLTEHKMAMVSNKFLGALCVKLGFHKHLLTHSDFIKTQVFDYVTDIEEAEKLSNGVKDYWTSVKAPPKSLPDVVEAYLGAVFVDSKFNYSEVQRFFDMHIAPFFQDMSIYDSFANNHPVTRLHHLLDNLGCSSYRIMAREISPLDEMQPTIVLAVVMVHNVIIAQGKAASGKNAKVKASKAALDMVDGLAKYEFRRKFHCNCRQGHFVEKGGSIGGAENTAI